MRNASSAGMAMAGCVVIGIGVGMLFDRTSAGTMIGIGCGLIAMALLSRL